MAAFYISLLLLRSFSSLVIKLEQMKFSKKFFKCLHSGERLPNLLYVCLPNDDFKQKPEAAQEEEEEEPASPLPPPLSLLPREFKYRFISHTLPSRLGSYALVSLSKPRRGTPLLPHNNNNNNDNAYAQQRCSRTRLHGHTPPKAGSRPQTMRGAASLLHLLLLQLLLLLIRFLQCKMLNGPKGPEQRTRQQQLRGEREGRGGVRSSLGQLFANLRL